MIKVKIHPHRANFGDNSLPKWYVHVGDDAPRAFHEVDWSMVDKTICVYDNAGCGCKTHTAQGWVEFEVEENRIDWERLSDGRLRFFVKHWEGCTTP